MLATSTRACVTLRQRGHTPPQLINHRIAMTVLRDIGRFALTTDSAALSIGNNQADLHNSVYSAAVVD